MQIFVRDLTGNKIPLEVEQNETVRDLKGRIANLQHKDPHLEFDLVYDGKILEDGKKLSEERVKDQVTMHVLAHDLSKIPKAETGLSPTGKAGPIAVSNLSTSPHNIATSPLKSPPSIDSYILTGKPKVDYTQSRFQLEGNKWNILGFREGNVVVDQASMGQSVFIQDCLNTRVEITSPKVNRILIDRCTDTTVVCNSAISGLEIVNGKHLEIYCNGSAPTVQVDLTHGINIHLQSTNPGILEMKFVNASCADFFLFLTDLDLKFRVPTSILQDQMASRISLSKKEKKFKLKSLPSETMKKGGYINLSMLDSMDRSNTPPV